MKCKRLILLPVIMVYAGFTGVSAQTVRDIDGNDYKTVTIGTQVWMAENLSTTRLNDGTPIPYKPVNDEWRILTAPAYCWYDNNRVANIKDYGALYNWYCVNSGKLCPDGWHVASDAEWAALTAFTGDTSIAGGKLKGNGAEWRNPNTGATNETGFTALPAGARHGKGGYFGRGYECGWWSSTESSDENAYIRIIRNYFTSVLRESREKENGLSVRCLKN